ncbi:cytochrome p450 [Trichoderma arundinaceum]|uniref:Cytochrome p450 n=1 Tax=Trichoderma arundinaceum TaxID=490622 RepID=A0A395NPS3_TRIAR|nr:cytochrome p450 [Trichoderma arundinaceum]
MWPELRSRLESGPLPLGPILIVVLGYIAYLVGLGIYRVYLSPLAKFPGPRLAALTTWYQAYYDVYLGGQFFKKSDELHRKYGPIVRVNPHEVQVFDPEFIDILYTSNSQRRNKYKWTGRSILLPESLVATEPHDLHRKRRAALSPFFSKTSIRRLEEPIQETLAAILGRMKTASKSVEMMPMSLIYKAATSDIITKYAFGNSTEYVNREDYNVGFFEAVDANFGMAWPMTYIAWLGPLMNSIPPSIMGIVYPGLKSLWQMHHQWTKQIKEINASKSHHDGQHSTIFHGIMSSNLPPSEKEPARLRQEAQLVILAGQDTTAYTLSAITYELLANPDKLAKLKEELVTALPDPDTVPTLAVVEKLPYLNAVIQEGLRVHPGALVRMTRVAPDNELIYQDKASGKKWIIPKNTPITMTALSVQMNETIFPNPRKFEPERWLENPRLDRYMLTFSKGSRICLGFHLAYSELYIILAGLFRKYDLYDGTGRQKTPTLDLYDTLRERDIDAHKKLPST